MYKPFLIFLLLLLLVGCNDVKDQYIPDEKDDFKLQIDIDRAALKAGDSLNIVGKLINLTAYDFPLRYESPSPIVFNIYDSEGNDIKGSIKLLVYGSYLLKAHGEYERDEPYTIETAGRYKITSKATFEIDNRFYTVTAEPVFVDVR